MNPDGGQAFPSWNSNAAVDVQLAEIQQTVLRYAKEPSIVGYQEPHSELRHNVSDMLREYGEVADDSFRVWLQTIHYQTSAAVARRWGLDGEHIPVMERNSCP